MFFFKRKPVMSSLQDLINRKLNAELNMDDFKSETIQIKVKNTYDRKCKKCGSTDIYVMSVQKRASDEATTKVYECLNCGNKWDEN